MADRNKHGKENAETDPQEFEEAARGPSATHDTQRWQEEAAAWGLSEEK
jgi:hypothetical protein